MGQVPPQQFTGSPVPGPPQHCSPVLRQGAAVVVGPVVVVTVVVVVVVVVVVASDEQTPLIQLSGLAQNPLYSSACVTPQGSPSAMEKLMQKLSALSEGFMQ